MRKRMRASAQVVHKIRSVTALNFIVAMELHSTLMVTLILQSTTEPITGKSGSGSGSGNGIAVNRPPSVTGCISTTQEVEAPQSLNIIEVLLPLNITFADPDGDNFTVASNTTALPSLSYINVSNLNDSFSTLSFPGNELGTMVRSVVVMIDTTATDTLDEQTTCSQNYRITITTPSICSLAGLAPVVERQILLQNSIELLTIDGNTRPNTVMDEAIQSTIATILNEDCPSNCSFCEMTSDCLEFLPFCQQFGSSNIEIINTQQTTVGRKRQVTVISYTIAVVNPTRNTVFRDRTIFLPAVLAQILNGNRARFTTGTGLIVVSINVNSISASGDISFSQTPIIIFFVAMLCLTISLIVGIAVVIQLGCAYKLRKKKNKVTPVKTEIHHVRPVSNQDTENTSINTPETEEESLSVSSI